MKPLLKQLLTFLVFLLWVGMYVIAFSVEG